MTNKTSALYLFEKSLKLSLSNIWRNKLLSIATIFVIGVIIFTFNIILAVNLIAQNALSDLSKKIDITVYIKESTTEDQVQKLINELKNFKEVENVTYTSKEDALKQIKSTHPDISLSFEKYNLGNPLPASINITTKDPKYHKAIADFLSQDQYKIYLSNVITANSKENNVLISSVSKNLIKLNDFTNQVVFWLIITFVFGGILIILNALQITIFNRKHEISIMKLVGASHWFIRSPFIIEAIIYGATAVILGFFMLIILTQQIEIQDTSLWQYYSKINFLKVFILELIITVVISITSSLIAIHEYLKKDLLEN